MPDERGHNFTGPGDECFYCGYEEDGCERYDLDCNAIQQLETRKAINHIACEVSKVRKEFGHLRRELECLRGTIRNHV